ncbi:MAG: hypothetical protein ACOYB3_03110 [Azonexus sp.]
MRIGDVSVISLARDKQTFRIDTDRPAKTFHEQQLARRSIQKAVGCLDVRMVDSPALVFTASAKSEKRQDDQNDDD